jgi:membrane-associated phospholipid phosphatase
VLAPIVIAAAFLMNAAAEQPPVSSSTQVLQAPAQPLDTSHQQDADSVPDDQKLDDQKPDDQKPDDRKPDDQKHDAKEPPTPEHTGLHALLGNLGGDIVRLPSVPNLNILLVGGAVAGGVHPFDHQINAHLQSHYDAVNAFFAPGKYIGSTQVQVAFSISAYAYGRFFDAPKVAHLGMDLLQAQILTEILIEPLKFAVGRERPDGSDNQSFPSGHSAITFATATVIERHLGWRKSVLAYVLAAYVATSRLHDNKHYLSDVVFGSAVGTVAGRTVVHHAADYWTLVPVSVPGGGIALYVTRTR